MEKPDVDFIKDLSPNRRLTILAADYSWHLFDTSARQCRFSVILNWIAAVLVTLCAVYLHVLFFLNAGGLWRDEAQLVHLSLLPSFSEMWHNLPHDSCPILMHLAVRAWSAVASLGNTEAGLRVLGLYMGLFLLLAFWFASWTMRKGAPLLAVTLAGLNVTIIRVGDSLRGYGLGSALGVLTLAVIWRNLPSEPCSLFLGSRGSCFVIPNIHVLRSFLADSNFPRFNASTNQIRHQPKGTSLLLSFDAL